MNTETIIDAIRYISAPQPEQPLLSVDPAILPESTQHLLSAYIEAGLGDQDAATRFPAVHQAIAEHSAFRREHDELRDLLAAERNGELEQPPVMPKFDLGYLLEDCEATRRDARPRINNILEERTMEHQLLDQLQGFGNMEDAASYIAELVAKVAKDWSGGDAAELMDQVAYYLETEARAARE